MLSESVSYEFLLELVSPPGGQRLDRRAVDRAYLQPLVEAAVWHAQRVGVVGADRSDISALLEPVFQQGAVDRRLRAISVRLFSPSGVELLRHELPLDVLRPLAEEALRDALHGRRLKLGDEYESVVLAHRSQGSRPQSAPTLLTTRVETHIKPLPLVPGRLDAWLPRARLVGEAAHDERDAPVIVPATVLAAAQAACRRDDGVEAGAFLPGRLFRQEDPPEIFVVIEGAVAACHAQEKEFSVAMTSQTYAYVEKQLALRRARLGRPEEVLVGTAHSHPFFPSLNDKGEPNCPGCSKRSTCPLDSSFFSGADMQYHVAMFSRQPYAIGLVWGLDPRGETVLRAFGFRDGVLRERSIHVVD